MSFSSKVKEELATISRKDFTLKGKTSKISSKGLIRDAFLQSGSISDPEKFYHLEIVFTSYDDAQTIKKLIDGFGLDGKIVERKGHYVVYLKEGAQIADMLRIMEAPMALMEFENIRIVKEMRNSINRQVNCEAANLGKTISAAVKQVEDIKFICSKVGLDNIPESLAETAKKRLEYPEATLKELGELMDPPLGKSGVNHRLKRLSELAEDLRSHKEEKLND
ncbi:MAG: DNA-binding protein WhiA [Lachnospiraceae bacterium]|nr:DNA-binding protein WhiA [Lachnospiraceae bacterium]